MNLEEFESSVSSLIYYLKYHNKSEADILKLSEQEDGREKILEILETSLNNVKSKVLSSTLMKDKSILKLFETYSIEEIKIAILDNFIRNRYYKFEIISKLKVDR